MTNRWHFACQWAGRHFVVSAVVVAIAAGITFFGWYPAPWREMLGVASIFGLVVFVDLVCGPLLTFVLANPRKSSRERWVDLALIATIQIAALGYGLWAVYSARPVVLVFEVDRFFVVTANEVQTKLLGQAPEGLRALPVFGVNRVGLRESKSSEEYLESVGLSVQGVTQAMRPNWWKPYDEAMKSAILQKSKPLENLLVKQPHLSREIIRAAKQSGQSVENLRYLPLTSSRELAWVALLDLSGEVVAYAKADGFE